VKRTRLGQLLIAYRGGIPQWKLAEAIGVSEGMIAHVESGRRSLGVDAVDAAARYFELSPTQRDDLLTARQEATEILATKRKTPSAPSDVTLLRSELEALTRRVEILEQGADSGGSVLPFRPKPPPPSAPPDEMPEAAKTTKGAKRAPRKGNPPGPRGGDAEDGPHSE
jgi:transcriptional regulator with XRE-family HTH domain